MRRSSRTVRVGPTVEWGSSTRTFSSRNRVASSLMDCAILIISYRMIRVISVVKVLRGVGLLAFDHVIRVILDIRVIRVHMVIGNMRVIMGYQDY